MKDIQMSHAKQFICVSIEMKRYFRSNPLYFKTIFFHFCGKLRESRRSESSGNSGGKCLPSLVDMKQMSLPRHSFPNAPGAAMALKHCSTSRRVTACPGAEYVQKYPRPAHPPPVVSVNSPPKPKNLQRVFSESSNPHRPGQGATAAFASAKYVPRGCWFRKLMPGHPRQNEEIGRNCFAG